MKVHTARGYHAGKFVVIPNGYDFNAYAPSEVKRSDFRDEWRLEADTIVIGMVGRWSPYKDHANLFAALQRLESRTDLPWTCVLVGPGITEDNEDLMALLDQYRVRQKCLLIGPQNDVPKVMNGLDIHVLSSAGEAFPE